MDTTKKELNDFFAIPPVTDLTPNVLGELQSILRIHSISPQELSYKWESYTMKMGTEQTKLDLTMARAFKKDLQEKLERESVRTREVRTQHRRALRRAVMMYSGCMLELRTVLYGTGRNMGSRELYQTIHQSPLLPPETRKVVE